MNAYEIEYHQACPMGGDIFKYLERDMKAIKAAAAAGQGFAHCLTQHALRNALVNKYAWAVPNDRALDVIKAYSPIVEMGAGLGYWAKLLTERGATVEAFDQVKTRRWNPGGMPWFPVKVGGPPRLRNYPDHALLLVWPPYRTWMASHALKFFTGNIVLYVGESSGGCTGNYQFHVVLERDWIAINVIDIPQWPGIHDRLYVLERRAKIEIAASGQARKIRLHADDKS